MRALTLALSVCVALLCCPIARAQVPKFTIVSITGDPPALAPGSKFKIKVVVRNDGDTIPAGRRFDFGFTSPDAVAIGQPAGTPALFFGFCPGATPANMVCQCFAAWEKGQTVEIETEVTVGSNARGAVTVTFRVSSGTVSETASVSVTLVVDGPDLIPEIVAPPADLMPFRVGSYVFFTRKMKNVGNLPTTGPAVMTIPTLAGVRIHEEYLSYTHTASIPAGATVTPFSNGLVVAIPLATGTHFIAVAVSGGGDVQPSNNVQTFQIEVILALADSLERQAKDLVRILEGR